VNILSGDPAQKVREAKRFLAMGLDYQTAVRNAQVHREVLGKTDLHSK